MPFLEQWGAIRRLKLKAHDSTSKNRKPDLRGDLHSFALVTVLVIFLTFSVVMTLPTV